MRWYRRRKTGKIHGYGEKYFHRLLFAVFRYAHGALQDCRWPTLFRAPEQPRYMDLAGAARAGAPAGDDLLSDQANAPVANTPVVPRPASTVLLLRDAPRGLEVFMVARNKNIKFASGALVFPGGRVDAADSDPRLRPHCAGVDDLDDPAFALLVSAVREVFEETGTFLARRKGEVAPLNGGDAAVIAERYRDNLLAETVSLLDIIEAENLELLTDQIARFAHWVTPESRPIRFDTHFYVAVMPPGQGAEHDGDESVASAWIAAQGAPQEIETKGFSAMFPTLVNLEKLADSPAVAEAMEAARAGRIEMVLPKMHVEPDGSKVVRISETAGYKTTSYPSQSKWIKS